jgi:hypothetical protein
MNFFQRRCQFIVAYSAELWDCERPVNRKGYGRTESQPNLRQCMGICLGCVKESALILKQDNRSLGRDLILSIPKYEAGVPTVPFCVFQYILIISNFREDRKQVFRLDRATSGSEWRSGMGNGFDGAKSLVIVTVLMVFSKQLSFCK